LWARFAKLAMVVFSFGEFFHCILLALLAEVGDKTWVLTSICAIWCPWEGLRNHAAKLLRIECLLVLLGAGFALTVRTILIAFGVDPFYWDGFSNVAAGSILFICAIKATWDCRSAAREYLDAREAASLGLADTETSAIKDATDAEGYGATGGTFSINYDRSCWDWTVLLGLAFFFPFIIVVFAEAMDRSQGILQTVDHRRLDLAMGAPVGFFCAAILAVLFGYAVQTFMDDRRWSLLLVAAALWIETFSCARDALTRLVMGDLPLANSSLAMMF